MVRIWKFIMLFISFWVVFGVLDLVISVIEKDKLDFQAVYLVIGMSILFFTARTNYIKVKNQDDKSDLKE